METIFLKLLNMSITAGWLVLAVVILRVLLKRVPKYISVLLWVLVGIRLICPVSIESALSLIPSSETFPAEMIYEQIPEIHSGIPYVNRIVNPALGNTLSPAIGASVNPMQIIIYIASVVWSAGVLVMVLYTGVSYLRIYRRVREAICDKDNIWICDNINTPFILGIVKPRIYLPSSISDNDRLHVIAHEKAHISRGDHLWKPIGFFLLTVYWFNPVMWIAYVLLCRDIELACDEKVIRQIGAEHKKAYSEALINCSAAQKLVSACPLAFGEVSTKSRIEAVLNYKKTTLWVIVAALFAVAVVSVCFLTDPEEYEVINEGYYLTIGEDNVSYISITTPESSGGCQNADGTPFKKGERIYLEWLSGATDLSGVAISAMGEDGEILFLISVPEGNDGKTTTVVSADGWLIAPSGVTVTETDGNSQLLVQSPLTLRNVMELSKRGNELSWEDFERFIYYETGSGLYIRQYNIDEMFTLFIGGTSCDEPPMYIYLHASDAFDEQIDIRNCDVRAFINEHKNNPVVKSISASWYCSPVGTSGEGYSKILEICGIDKNYAYSSIEYLPVIMIESKNELNRISRELGKAFDLSKSYEDVISFEDACDLYDEAFFGEMSLLMIYTSQPSKENRHTVEYIKYSEGELSVGVMVIDPESSDVSKEEWLITVTVPKEQAGNISTIRAVVSSVNYPNSGTSGAELIKQYVFKESVAPLKPSVSLFDNGKFTFTFSALSSYAGVGDYTVADEQLVLKTEDGKYTYVFDIQKDAITFDAESSTKQLWYSGISDGDIFS